MAAEEGPAVQAVTLPNNLLLTLRPAEASDAEQVLAFVEQVAGESENISFGPGEFGIGLEEERIFLQQCADSPRSLFLLAELGKVVVGTLSFSTGTRPRQHHCGEFGTSVRRDYWNLGIGGHMLAYLLNWARQTLTVRKINLRVRVDNLPAIHLYEKFGFAKEGRVTRELYVHDEFVDAYIMGLELDPPRS